MSSKVEKRQLFLDKLAAEQPVMLSNIQMSPSGTTFFNYSTIIKDVPPHAVKFKFSPGKQNISKVQSLLQDYTSGFFTVSGLVHLLGEPHHPNNSTKLVCDATITDDTGVINLSIWEEHIPQILNGQFYTITNLKLRFYQEKCLATTTTTTVSPAEKQNLSQVKPQPKNNCLCCPKILNIDITVYPVCNNNSCKKKLDANPGTRLLRCLKCKKSMLLDNCSIEMNIIFTLQKDSKRFSATAFPKVIAEFLGEDIYAYSNDTTLLEEKILLLTNVDFHLSNDNRLITSMQHHPDKQISQDAALNDDQDSTKQHDGTQIPEQEFLMADHNSSTQHPTQNQTAHDCQKTD